MVGSFAPFFPDSDEAAMSHLDALTRTDPEIAQLIRDEETRQDLTVRLIPS